MANTRMGIKKIGWGLGNCNMHCRHCYNASGGARINYALADLKIIADKICRQGITDINFGTGEFLLNDNSLQLAQYIKQQYPQVSLGLTTNGYSVINIPPSELKRLFHDIDVSIDFPDQIRHNNFRGHPLAWQWANQSLAICQKLELASSIVTCVTSRTTDEDLIALLKMAKKYRCSLRINWFRPTGRGKKYLCISPWRFWQIINLLTHHAIFEGLSDPLLRSFLLDQEAKVGPTCACAWTSARIQADLTVSPCVFLKGEKWSSGQILTDPLSKIYHHHNFQKVRERQPNLCLKCDHYTACQGGCASRAYLQAGDLNQRDAYCPLNSPRTKRLIADSKKHLQLDNSDKVHNGYLCTLIVRPK